MLRPRASTIDTVSRPVPGVIKVKQEPGEAKMIKKEPGIEAASYRSSSVCPGVLENEKRKKVSSLSKQTPSRKRNPSLLRIQMLQRRRSNSRSVSASPAPSTLSTATNTTSGLRLDVCGSRTPQRQMSSTLARLRNISENTGDDDGFSIVSHTSTPQSREKITNKLTCVINGGWTVNTSFDSYEVSNPAVATKAIERLFNDMARKIQKQIADGLY